MAKKANFDYDLIIVGAGTAGCVLANRLSEDPNISVLVLEAGGDRSDDERVYTPGLAVSALHNPDFDWQFASQPELGLNDRIIKHPRGRLVGGTSAINSFALIYPSAAEIDAWAELGDEGWNWQTLAPYFRKFQTIVPPSEEVKKVLNIAHSDANIRESNGPIQASFPLRANALQKAWVDTFRTLGLNNRNDPLDGHALGGHTSTCHITSGMHERSHAGTAYLKPALLRSNLSLITNALVERLVIEQQESESIVRGVLFSKDGKLCEVRARREVVLAAGTFNSPQIMELSGIGNPEVLKQHGIDIVFANPAVGENLQDHIRPGISFEVNDDVPVGMPMPPEEARKLYEKDRSGPWAEMGAFSFSYTPLLPFLDSLETEQLKTLLNEHLEDDEHSSPFMRKRNAFIRKEIESRNEATAVTFMIRRPVIGAPEGNYLTLCSMLSHPLSAGNSHIASNDPQVKPKIKFNYYSHPVDLEIQARQVQALKRIARTEPLASYIKSGGKQAPVEHPADSIEDAKELCRAYASTNYHPCGTCALGEVVDGRLRVKGVTNLRVVDASVMPIIPRGNIITTVYAIAERAADIISEDLHARGHYTLVINLASASHDGAEITVTSSASSKSQKVHASSGMAVVEVALLTESQNTITIKSSATVESINVTPPDGTFYPTQSGRRSTNLTANGAASISVAKDQTAGSFRYVELTEINNDVSLTTSWTNGTNSRNITVAVNGHDHVRLEVPLSGRSSELYSPMKGWGDPETLGVLVDGFGLGDAAKDEIVVSNVNGGAGVQPFGADFVGLRVI